MPTVTTVTAKKSPSSVSPDWEELDRAARALQGEIFVLQRQREAILRQDAEYAAYLDAFAERGEGTPMSIRLFHTFSKEMERITADFERIGDYEDAWRKHRKRVWQLEKLLLA